MLGNLNTRVMIEYLPEIWQGFLTTLFLSAACFAGALMLGVLACALTIQPVRWLRAPAIVYVDAIRSTPLLAQLYFLYFGLPRLGILVPELVIGIIAGFLFAPEVPIGLQFYLPIAVVAALDAVFGGLRAFLDGIFDDKVFVVSFVSNVIIAAAIVFLGDQLGVGNQLSTGVIVVLGIRIFSNVAAIRRHVFHA